MKLFIAALLLFAMTCQVALADCDYSKIVASPDGQTYTYSRELHLCVGRMKKDLDSANTQIADYKSAITLKDLAMVDSEKRTDLWMNSTFALQDRMSKIDSLEKKNNTLYFVLGILVTSAAVYGAGQLAHK